MKTLLSVFGIVLLTLALGGCYVSKQPLFDRKDAVYPFADGTRYIEYTQSGGAWNEYVPSVRLESPSIAIPWSASTAVTKPPRIGEPAVVVSRPEMTTFPFPPGGG